MKNKISINAWLILLFAFLLGVISYWFQPYNQSTVFGFDIWKIVAVGSFVLSLIFGFKLKSKYLKISLRIAAGVGLGILLRIIYDTFVIPQSHNLFPFEMGFYLGISFASALLASAVPALYYRLNPNKTDNIE